MFENATLGLNTLSLAYGLDRDADGDLLGFSNFVEIDVQYLSGKRVVLDFLDQRQPFGTGIVFDGKIDQEVLGNGVVNQVLHFFRIYLKVLWLSLATVNDGGNTPIRTEFFSPGATSQRAGECIQRY